jgi:hypothetical protein
MDRTIKILDDYPYEYLIWKNKIPEEKRLTPFSRTNKNNCEAIINSLDNLTDIHKIFLIMAVIAVTMESTGRFPIIPDKSNTSVIMMTGMAISRIPGWDVASNP